MAIDLGALPANGGFFIHGDATGDNLGWSLASAGDFNGDGLDDLIIGAPFGDNGGSNAGEAYVIFGKAGAARGTINVGALAAGDGFVIQGDSANDRAGFSVASAGDVNGDGRDDLIVGAPFADGDTGRAYVIFGKAGATRANLDLGALAAGDGFVIEGAAANDEAGFSVAGAGDVNGDGIDDLVIGAPLADQDNGEAYVIFGKAGATRANIDLGALASGDGFAIGGGGGFYYGYNYTGWSVAGAGDVNGDGLDDVIIGAPRSASGYFEPGEAFVIYGKAGAVRGDVDLGLLTPADGFTIQGIEPDDAAGRSVAGAGDVNGDGFDDVIVGVPLTRYGDGETFVVFGKAGPRGTVDLLDLAAGDGFAISGGVTYYTAEYVGWSVAGAGDINGDGIGDLLVGAPGDDYGYGYPGEAYLVFGREGAGRADIFVGTLGGDDGFIIAGAQEFDRTGWSVTAAGDVNGDGLADFAVAAPTAVEGDDERGRVYVVLGPAGNRPPVVKADTATTNEDTPVLIDVLANDSDPDPGQAVGIVGTPEVVTGLGSVSVQAGKLRYDPGASYQGLSAGESAVVTLRYAVTDGNGGPGTGNVTVTVTGLSDPPVARDDNLGTLVGEAAFFPVATLLANDSDVDGGAPVVTAVGNPTNGTVSLLGGIVRFEPAAGFVGAAGFDYTISDGKGGTDTGRANVAVTIAAFPLTPDWRLFAASGFAGAIGGDGSVVGTGGFQDITVLDREGTISFDPSFNRGGDIVRLAGNAAAWQVARVGSSAVFSDGDTSAIIPVGFFGSTATTIVFDDGPRALRLLSLALSDMRIGSQPITSTLTSVTAAASGQPLPGGEDPAATARLVLVEDASVSLGGRIDLFGTGASEEVTLIDGDVRLDPSFNTGGDTIVIAAEAADFSAVRQGSSVRLDSDSLDVLIPAGPAGATLAFSGGDERELLVDVAAGGIRLGDQLIGFTPVALSEFG